MINKILVINIDDITPRWLKVFDETSILNLKICNQTLLDYYLHFARHIGFKQVVITHPEYDENIWEYEKINYFSFPIKCEISPIGETLEYFKLRNENLFSGVKTIGVTEPVFIYFDLKNENLRNQFDKNEDMTINSEGGAGLVVKSLRSLRDFFDLSLSILDKYHDSYFFREFTIKQNGVFFGRGADVKNIHSVKEKSIIGNYVIVHPNSFISSRCVVADYSVVNKGVELENTIVYSSSNLAAHLNLKNKIIFRNAIIDPFDEKVPNLDFSNQEIENYCENFWIRMSALTLLLISIIPSLLVEMLFLPVKKKSITFKDINGNKFTRRYLLEEGGLTMFYEYFNFTMAIGFIKVLKGDILLVGRKSNVGGKKFSLFHCSDFVMDQDFKIGSDILERYYELKKNFF